MQENYTYPSSNYNNLFNNKQFISKLIQEVMKRLGRSLKKIEQKYFLQLIRNINPHTLNGTPPNTVLKKLGEYLAIKINEYDCGKNQEVDMHELLKSEIGVENAEYNSEIEDLTTQNFADEVTGLFSNSVDIVSLFGESNINKIQDLLTQKIQKKKVYVILDTRNRVLDTDGTISYRWNLINNEIVGQGTANYIGNVGNIIGMRVYPFKIPYITAADNEYERITMFIEEFTAQSFISPENRFHFIFRPTIVDRWIELSTDKYNEGFYYFHKPITNLDTMTVRFGSPYDHLLFDRDRMNATINSYSNPIEFLTEVPHNLETGDLVYIRNFTSRNPDNGIDTPIINDVNIAVGHGQDDLVVTGSNTFTIDVDGSVIRRQGLGTISTFGGSQEINGTGTQFLTGFRVGDFIEIVGIIYEIGEVVSNTTMFAVNNIVDFYFNVNYFKANDVIGLSVSLYLGAKRISIPLELEYISTNGNNNN